MRKNTNIYGEYKKTPHESQTQLLQTRWVESTKSNKGGFDEPMHNYVEAKHKGAP